jgi:murein DD-endopeptidase MepM/ murein hydrolase activator NlpD
MAINRGVVTFAGPLGLYGNTIVLDHGFGLESFYMHLSEIDVKQGEMVQRDQVIGASGETGYAEGPHLHLTVRVGGISIDPMVFLGFFQKS